ncbi:MAG: DUF4339 domain-containing protein [Bradyrhizobium sp.]|uniref:DUF4339 domain-containing protein n=1 Tax=Bradyrhizobium sp. TaxID=376 RepID=UPI0027308176|nr:DUF4339 domain-containing protein [Bradyrhizobium sp.]MDP1865760.1 DUF4339 domain-containing protein [Bradyrhizobium sp.]
MAARSWFYASEGQQQGPYPEIQLRELIARGTITADTLVWTEGMANWQRAAEIPGLAPDASGPPAVPRSGAAVPRMGGYSDGPVSIDLPLWSFLGRSLLYIIGLTLVIPAPWAGAYFYQWAVSRLVVPGRPNLAFTGQVGDLWWVFVLMGLSGYAGIYDDYLQLLMLLLQGFLSWTLLRWLASRLTSNGQPLPIAFNGSLLTFIGWQILLAVSFITIIGWAWVATAWTRWICRNVEGTRREIVFNASGLGVLWRTILLVIGCGLIVPIPWVIRWYTQWYVSQFELVERGTLANA